jgi:hypothetical protein
MAFSFPEVPGISQSCFSKSNSFIICKANS